MIILVVEDEAIQGCNLERLFQARGHIVEWAASGSSALNKFRILKPDAVILDLCLPDVCTAEMLAAVYAVVPKVVVLTGMRGGEVDGLAEKYPKVVFLEKPCSGDDIIAAVESAG